MRGCPFKCVFCSRVAIGDLVRYRDHKLVVDEIESQKKLHNVDSFVFLDDTFTMKKTHVMKICDEI